MLEIILEKFFYLISVVVFFFEKIERNIAFFITIQSYSSEI